MPAPIARDNFKLKHGAGNKKLATPCNLRKHPHSIKIIVRCQTIFSKSGKPPFFLRFAQLFC